MTHYYFIAEKHDPSPIPANIHEDFTLFFKITFFALQKNYFCNRSNRHFRMARKLRVEYPGALYHVMNRGDRREEEDKRTMISMIKIGRAFQTLKMWLLYVIAALAALVVILSAVYKHYYPHGLRSGMLPTFMSEMWGYAQNNGGWYPRGGKTPLESLQQLYPEYESEGLAGLSGNEGRTLRLLKSNKPLDATVSSWIYWPGFRMDDDPDLAIIWEREEGLFTTGGRASGHAVGFAGGGCTQIGADKWADFLREQELRREKVFATRAGTKH